MCRHYEGNNILRATFIYTTSSPYSYTMFQIQMHVLRNFMRGKGVRPRVHSLSLKVKLLPCIAFSFSPPFARLARHIPEIAPLDVLSLHGGNKYSSSMFP